MRKIVFIFVLLLIGIAPLIIPSYSEYISPKKQLELGILPEDIQCRENRILVDRGNSRTVACVTEKTAERMDWSIIKTEFTNDKLIDDKKDTDSNTDVHETPTDTATLATATTANNPAKEFVKFPITSDVEFSGEEYGYYDPQTLRRPAPRAVSETFSGDLYDIPQILQNNAASLSEGTITPHTLLANIITSNSTHVNTIDYRQWMPSTIPAGFELKWITVTQPGWFGGASGESGSLYISYFPNTVTITPDMMTYEISDIALIEIFVRTTPYKEVPMLQSTIDRITKNGASTQVLVEERHGGTYVTLVESPSNPNVKSVTLFTNTLELNVGGKGVPLETYEDIFLDIFERQ